MRERQLIPKVTTIFVALTMGLSSLCCGQGLVNEEVTLKIINWNVLYGFNHKKSINQGVDWITEQHPDVVALQELNGHTEAELSKIAKAWGHAHAVILKEEGFPVGLTSNQPIKVIRRQVEGFHHGYLHCKTQGIHFFVVHFWPGKYHEADVILAQVEPLLKQQESVIILGDFNGCSRKDEAFLIANAKQRKPDYKYVDKVESLGFVDIVCKHDENAKVSCPSPITIPRWSADLEELKLKRFRIDFVFANKKLAKESRSGTISLAKEIETISDHYPVIVELITSVPKEENSDDGR